MSRTCSKSCRNVGTNSRSSDARDDEEDAKRTRCARARRVESPCLVISKSSTSSSSTVSGSPWPNIGMMPCGGTRPRWRSSEMNN